MAQDSLAATDMANVFAGAIGAMANDTIARSKATPFISLNLSLPGKVSNGAPSVQRKKSQPTRMRTGNNTGRLKRRT